MRFVTGSVHYAVNVYIHIFRTVNCPPLSPPSPAHVVVGGSVTLEPAEVPATPLPPLKLEPFYTVAFEGEHRHEMLG